MKAVYYEEFGPADRLRMGELPVPDAGDDQILVRVAASSVNPIDRRLRSGELQQYFERKFPIVPGWDVAGRVVAVGKSVKQFAIGDDVAALAFTWVLHHGTYAEYAVVNAASAARKPTNLSFVQAAALPLITLTAWQALIEYGGLATGQSVLIHAGAGGLGSAALSIARLVGAKIYTTARAHNHRYVKERGADRAIDYTTEDYVEILKKGEPNGIDVVLSSLEDPKSNEEALRLAKAGGAVAYMNNDPPPIAELKEKKIKAEFLHHRPDGAMLDDLLKKYGNGDLALPKIETITLDDAIEAHKRSESWQTTGKLVIVVDRSL